MLLWLRVRQTPTLLAVAVAVVALAAVAPGATVTVPVVSGAAYAVPLLLLLPLALVVALAQGLARGEKDAERSARRPLRALDMGLAFGVTTGCAGVLWLGTGSSALGAAAGRNALAFLGLMLLARVVAASHLAVLVPVGVAVTCALFGVTRFAEPAWWAWVLADGSSLSAAILAGTAAATGAAAYVRWGPACAAQNSAS